LGNSGNLDASDVDVNLIRLARRRSRPVGRIGDGRSRNLFGGLRSRLRRKQSGWTRCGRLDRHSRHPLVGGLSIALPSWASFDKRRLRLAIFAALSGVAWSRRASIGRSGGQRHGPSLGPWRYHLR
jgi:hypothetical protein